MRQQDRMSIRQSVSTLWRIVSTQLSLVYRQLQARYSSVRKERVVPTSVTRRRTMLLTSILVPVLVLVLLLLLAWLLTEISYLSRSNEAYYQSTWAYMLVRHPCTRPLMMVS